jgi:hypothetical protein
MIIFGSKGQQKEIAQGTFYCPKCNDIRPYKQKRASKYFTLYFIPLFETKNLGEFVECQACRTTFDPKILEPNSQAMLRLVASTRYALLHGTPPNEMKSQLMQSGADSQTADRIIQMAQS